jgi:hypothetical protein
MLWLIQIPGHTSKVISYLRYAFRRNNGGFFACASAGDGAGGMHMLVTVPPSPAAMRERQPG